MNDLTHLLHKIDRYLNGQMNEAEERAFEALRRDNGDVEKEFHEQAAFRSMLQDHADRKAFIQKLHAAEEKITAHSGMRSEKGKNNIFQLSRQAWRMTGIAAAVAVLVATAALWITGGFSNDSGSTYMILRREIDNIKKSQTALMKDFNSSHTRPPADPGSFGGTGFAISSDGYITTNRHVIRNADSVYVQNNKGEAYKANIVYQDPVSDLAVLKVEDSAFMLPALPYTLAARSADIGEDVFTLGFPKDDMVYGKGYISAETGFEGDTCAYQIALTVNPGNSGGPLIDDRGNILGIVSGKQTSANDIAFAIKSHYLKSLIDSIPAMNRKCSILHRSTNSLRLSRVDQIKKLEDYMFLVKVYN
ncbi:S1C family serine protease [Compostibacter hankyongensis]|uniref:Trypsin-like peptidase domain-containing protein n=1 Tax=Compostibacter hankyongensis TaxID=1007089 RepID=A0ABP8FRX5_9BACT